MRQEAYLVLEDADAGLRSKVFAFLESLSANPFDEGDYSITGEGRTFQVKILGALAVYFWCDHSDKEIRVVDLIQAESL